MDCNRPVFYPAVAAMAAAVISGMVFSDMARIRAHAPGRRGGACDIIKIT
ncbi:hypothetical protein SXCC_02524 [Gluconacetobacter sp. SXCC-1]|nr:hypothetical protein SXCC_02524 [Gluconacetobacter sp. SXCC-1]